MALNTGEIMGYQKRLFMSFISAEWSFCGKQGADLFLMETQPSLKEALTEAKIAEEIGQITGSAFRAWMKNILTKEKRSLNAQKYFLRMRISIPHLKMLGSIVQNMSI